MICVAVLPHRQEDGDHEAYLPSRTDSGGGMFDSAGRKPLMLETFLHRPLMERAAAQCLADGVQRFFIVCPPRFAAEAAACFPGGNGRYGIRAARGAAGLSRYGRDHAGAVPRGGALCRGRPRLCLCGAGPGAAGGLEGSNDQRGIPAQSWCRAGCRYSGRRPSRELETALADTEKSM